MRKKLTTKTIDALQPAVGKRYEVRDTHLPGFMVRVSCVGKKVFYLNKRIDGRSRRIKLGEYPMMSLAEARQKAQGILRDISLGEFEKDSAGSPERSVPTLNEVVEQFIGLYAKPRNKDWKGAQSVLRKFSVLNSRPINQINRRDVHEVLDRIVASGTPTRANRALAAIKKLMNWAVDRGYMARDIAPYATAPATLDIQKSLTVNEFIALFTPEEYWAWGNEMEKPRADRDKELNYYVDIANNSGGIHIGSDGSKAFLATLVRLKIITPARKTAVVAKAVG